MIQPATRLEAILRRDRMIVFASLALIAGLAWVYLGYLAWDMQRGMGADSVAAVMSQARPGGGIDFGLTFFMWAVMMMAMMVPTAAPMLLTFATINRRRSERSQPFVPTGVFLMGYLTVWFAFAALATGIQWGLHQAALLSTMMGSATPVIGGVILLVAGAFQWTSIKNVCLKQCRTPMAFIMTEWRDGTRGALIMGMSHGRFCLGCCWFLMGLMFVAGVMNILWMAVVALYILAEKVTPAGHSVGRVVGVGLIGWGAWTLLQVVI